MAALEAEAAAKIAELKALQQQNSALRQRAEALERSVAGQDETLGIMQSLEQLNLQRNNSSSPYSSPSLSYGQTAMDSGADFSPGYRGVGSFDDDSPVGMMGLAAGFNNMLPNHLNYAGDAGSNGGRASSSSIPSQQGMYAGNGNLAIDSGMQHQPMLSRGASTTMSDSTSSSLSQQAWEMNGHKAGSPNLGAADSPAGPSTIITTVTTEGPGMAGKQPGMEEEIWPPGLPQLQQSRPQTTMLMQQGSPPNHPLHSPPQQQQQQQGSGSWQAELAAGFMQRLASSSDRGAFNAMRQDMANMAKLQQAAPAHSDTTRHYSDDGVLGDFDRMLSSAPNLLDGWVGARGYSKPRLNLVEQSMIQAMEEAQEGRAPPLDQLNYLHDVVPWYKSVLSRMAELLPLVECTHPDTLAGAELINLVDEAILRIRTFALTNR